MYVAVKGGAAAIATKKGFWAVLGSFLAAGWKFIAAGAMERHRHDQPANAVRFVHLQPRRRPLLHRLLRQKTLFFFVRFVIH